MTMNYGYGICGHKNSFSTNALLGNYVEDQFGRDLASNAHRGLIPTPKSEFQSAYIPPRQMPDKMKDAPVVQPDPIMNARDGLTADMMFRHNGDDSAKNRRALPQSPKIGALPDSTDAMRARVKALARADREATNRTSEAVACTKYVQKSTFVVDDADQEPLPIFTRRKLQC